MLMGVVEQAALIATKSILNSEHFKNRSKLDPIVDKANDYKIVPFKSGWARRQERGTVIEKRITTGPYLKQFNHRIIELGIHTYIMLEWILGKYF